MNKLDTKVLKIAGVLSYKDLDKSCFIDIEDTKDLIKKAFDSNSSIDEYYIIYHHDAEISHFHYCLVLKRQVRLKTMLNYIADTLKINPLAVSIDKCNNVSSMIRYFLHIDSEEKFKYKIEDIESNMSLDIIKNYIDSDDDSLSFRRLCQICDGSNEIDVMATLGLKLFHKYRYEIKLLCDNQYSIDRILEKASKTDPLD